MTKPSMKRLPQRRPRPNPRGASLSAGRLRIGGLGFWSG